MVRALLLGSACLLALSSAVRAQVAPFPASFRTRDISTNGATIHVRVGGAGPAVVLLHGFGDTGDMWAPLATELARTHTVIVPDLRGMGLSSHPAGGYEKRTEAADIAGVLDSLGIVRTDVVGHDIGTMVAFAFTARYPARVSHLVLMDAPIPGVANWDELSHAPQVWHFHFQGPDVERLVAGRERIYLDRFWNELSADRTKIDEATRVHYARLYARPGAMHSAFNQFAAFDEDAKDNVATLGGRKLATPVLAIGGESSLGAQMATVARGAFTDVRGVVVPHAGHWLMEEQPKVVIASIMSFLAPSP